MDDREEFARRRNEGSWTTAKLQKAGLSRGTALRYSQADWRQIPRPGPAVLRCLQGLKLWPEPPVRGHLPLEDAIVSAMVAGGLRKEAAEAFGSQAPEMQLAWLAMLGNIGKTLELTMAAAVPGKQIPKTEAGRRRFYSEVVSQQLRKATEAGNLTSFGDWSQLLKVSLHLTHDR